MPPLSPRHAELVSASIQPDGPTARVDKWTLKQVQGDGSFWGYALDPAMAVIGWLGEWWLCMRRPYFRTLRSASVCDSFMTVAREDLSAMRYLQNRAALAIVAFAATLLASCPSYDPCALNGQRVTWSGMLTWSHSEHNPAGGFFLKTKRPTTNYAGLYKTEHLYDAFLKDGSQASKFIRLRKPFMRPIDIVGIWRGSAGYFGEECGLPGLKGKFFEVEEVINPVVMK